MFDSKVQGTIGSGNCEMSVAKHAHTAHKAVVIQGKHSRSAKCVVHTIAVATGHNTGLNYKVNRYKLQNQLQVSKTHTHMAVVGKVQIIEFKVQKTCTHLFQQSATYTSPLSSTHIPQGPMNLPGSEPLPPNS